MNSNADTPEALGSQVVRSVRPCGWRWLDSWIFRKRVPSYSTQSEWGPVYDKEALDAAVAAERERCARIVERINGWTGTREVAAEIRGETQILRA